MDNNPSPPSDVLHSENHSKLTAEEIAKAVARHNKNHSGAPRPAGDSPKGKKTKA